MKKETCADAIIKTLRYRSIFNYPMSFYQIGTFLLAEKEYSHDLVSKSLEYLVRKGKVERAKDKYYIKGIKPINWKQRAKTSKALIRDNENLLRMIGQIPWIRMMAVTGSVAAFNADKKADIDLLIISKKNRVWLTRGFTTLMVILMGKFHKGKEVKGTFCTNIFMDETNLAWNSDKRNIYTAHEIALIQPIIFDQEIYFEFMKCNSWIGKYIPNFKVSNIVETVLAKKTSPIIDAVENMARSMQYRYMKKKRTTEQVDKKRIHFNKNDNAPKILKKYFEFK